MSRALHQRAAVLYALVGVISVGAALTAMLRWSYHPAAAHVAQLRAASPAELRVLIARLGLSAEAVTAAGLDAGQVTAVIERLRAKYADFVPALEMAANSQHAAGIESERLRAKIVAGRGSDADVAALAASNAQAASASRSLAAAQEAIMGDLQSIVGAQQIRSIGTIQGNHSWNGIPLHFRVVTRSEAEWVALRNAIASRDVSARRGESPSSSSLAVISAAESDGAVVAAKARLQADTGSVAAALTTAINRGG